MRENLFSLFEPVSLSPWDLQNYLTVLHVLQNKKDYPIIKDEYSDDKYRMTLKMRDLYDLLSIPGSGSGRNDLKDSIIYHVETVFRVRRPKEDIIYLGLGLHAGTLKFTGTGRKGLTCEFHPDKSLIDDGQLTENVSRILSYRYGMSKLIDFLVIGKMDAGVSLTERGWLAALSRGERLNNFKTSFYPALEELSNVSFDVTRNEEGKIRVKYRNKEKLPPSQSF
ncbi:MAG: hypothetical protein EOM51_11295 [Clostridia bacterium]|nr:hypothetical protein [Clostridia bacterium]